MDSFTCNKDSFPFVFCTLLVEMEMDLSVYTYSPNYCGKNITFIYSMNLKLTC